MLLCNLSPIGNPHPTLSLGVKGEDVTPAIALASWPRIQFFDSLKVGRGEKKSLRRNAFVLFAREIILALGLREDLSVLDIIAFGL
jgi:hypothetical protein